MNKLLYISKLAALASCILLACICVWKALGYTGEWIWMLLPFLASLESWPRDVLIELAGFLMIMVAFIQQTISSEKSKGEQDLQRFEDKLFQMIQLHQQNVSFINQGYQHDPQNEESDFFYFTYDHFEKKSTREFSYLQQEYKKWYANYRHFIDHFIRHLVFMLTYIENAQVLKGRRKLKPQYFQMLENQLNTSEIWLFYIDQLIREDEINEANRELIHQLHHCHTFFKRVKQLPIAKDFYAVFPYQEARPKPKCKTSIFSRS